MSEPTATGTARYAGTWVILPTYNEADNVAPIAAAILERLPGAQLLIVDDASPDGTGRLADELAASDPRIRVRHRAAKEGLGPAYLDGFTIALAGGAERLVQMDADWSHDPASLPGLVAALEGADLVLGSRYVRGGGVRDWGPLRRLISRGGSLFARTVLALRQRDLTGGFKAWRAATLAALPREGIHSGGYVFQIEMTYRASRAGFRVREIPIIFTDRLKQLLFHWREPASRDFILKLAAAFVITGVGGLVLKKLDFELPDKPAPVAWATLIGGVLILAIERWLRGKALRTEVSRADGPKPR